MCNVCVGMCIGMQGGVENEQLLERKGGEKSDREGD